MAEAAAAPREMGLREFAAAQGWKPSYVTELKRAERLVLSPDGRRVLVAESLQRIADTRTPGKQGVAARHAATRAAAAPASAPAEEGDDSPAGAPTAPAIPFNDPLAMRRARAQAETEEARARKALRDEQLELGQLLQREEVEAAIAGAVTTLRTSLQNLPSTLAPELAAATTEDRCHVLLANGIEHALEELSRKLSSVGRRG